MANISQEERYKKQLERIELKLKTRKATIDESLVDDYEKLIGVLKAAAFGNLKGVTPAGQVSAADKLVTKIEKLREELELEGKDLDSPEAEEILGAAEVDIASNVSLINF